MSHAIDGRTFVRWGLMFAAVLIQPAALRAAEFRPVAVVSIASYERLVTDINLVVDPRLTALARELLGRIVGIPTDPRTLAPRGLDPRRPWGLIVESNGQSTLSYGFFPVTSLGALLAGPVVKGKIPPPREGVYRAVVGGETWYLRQEGAWAAFAQTPAGLEAVPHDPTDQLQGINRSSDLAARILFEDFPAEQRELAGRWIRERHSVILDHEPGENAIQYAIRNALANQGLARLANLAEEGDTLSIGLSADTRSRSLVGELRVTYRPGTSMTESLAAPSKLSRDFEGFYQPAATLSGEWNGEITRMPLYQLLSLLDAVIKSGVTERRNPRGLDLWRTVRDTLQEDSVEGGVSLVTGSRGAMLVLGSYVADGVRVERQLVAAVEPMAKEPAGGTGVTWKRDVARYHDLRFHVISFPIDAAAPNRRQLVSMFGKSVDVAVAIDAHHLYVAIGKNALTHLKQVVRRCLQRNAGRSRSRPPVRFSLNVAELIQFMADVGPERDQWQLHSLAGFLNRFPGRNHITLSAFPVDRGVQARFEMEEGVLRSVTALNKLARR